MRTRRVPPPTPKPSDLRRTPHDDEQFLRKLGPRKQPKRMPR